MRSSKRDSSPAFGVDAAAPLVTPRSIAHYAAALPQSGVGAVFATVASLEDTATSLRKVAAWLEVSSSRATLARSVADVRASARSGKLGVVLHFQGTAPFADEPALVPVFARLGVRVVQLTYNYRSLVGDGCFEPFDGGLSGFGQQVLGRLNESRVLVDVAHAGVRTSLDAIGSSAAPVIATHANARAVCDTPRNLTDEQIEAIGGSGGMIGVCAFPSFVDAAEPSLERLIDHVLYIANLIGIDRVGLGLDFADEDEEDYDFFGYDPRYYPRPPWRYPDRIASYDDFPNIAMELQRRGLSDAEIAGVLGENVLRVCEAVWGA